MKEVKYKQLNKDEKELLSAAEEVMQTAYNPYSEFFVGAALLSKDGEIVTGSNVENAAYGSTICAERSAILRGNAKGIREFSTLAIISKGKDFDTTEVSAPCGACRQMIYESSQISNRDIKIILSTTKKDKIITTSISELLPLAFGPKDLGMDLQRFKSKK
jgi:cytidine deaminase